MDIVKMKSGFILIEEALKITQIYQLLKQIPPYMEKVFMLKEKWKGGSKEVSIVFISFNLIDRIKQC
jgi:hypothetical protein